MKLYGSARRDCQECKWGCCGHKALYFRRGTPTGKRVKAALRGRARREDREMVNLSDET